MMKYKFLLFILSPIIVCYTIFRAIKFADLNYLKQRLSLVSITSQTKLVNSIWIHAASVGEVFAVIPLIHQISKQYPHNAIYLTSNTTTSAEIIKTQLSSIANLQHYYMPIDWSWAVQRLVKAFRPRCIIIVETELWPNLYKQCFKQNIPIIIVNARLSHRTTSAKPWLLQLYKELLAKVTLILTRSMEDLTRYQKLGADDSKLKLVGNIKYSYNKDLKITPIQIERPYVLAASTHNDEEIQLVSMWLQLVKRRSVKKELLVIVPRHPDRLFSITQQLKSLNAKISIRSKNDIIDNSTQIYIADTVGELKQFILGAKFVFMGGSLVAHGGQNIIEAAQLSKAIIFGQHMFNFKNESELLLQNNAAIQVKNITELSEVFVQLLQTPEKIVALSESASSVIHNQENSILQLYMQELEKYIN